MPAGTGVLSWTELPKDALFGKHSVWKGFLLVYKTEYFTENFKFLASFEKWEDLATRGPHSCISMVNWSCPLNTESVLSPQPSLLTRSC